MTDTCRDTIAFLDDYLEGTLSSEQLALFELHLGKCPYCRDYLKTYRDTILLSRAVAGPTDDPAPDPTIAEPPPDLVEAIMRSVSHAQRKDDGGD
jgi:predicted anti-sigma-YlaC factor YlaD